MNSVKFHPEADEELLAATFDAGLAVNAIATIERGEAKPSVAVLLAISRVLKVKVRDLCQGSQDCHQADARLTY